MTDALTASTTSGTATLTVAGPPASPGNSLRVREGAGAIRLAWADAAGADAYEILRCDAAAGPCSLAAYDTSAAATYDDVAATGAILWYRVAAVNNCGRTP